MPYVILALKWEFKKKMSFSPKLLATGCLPKEKFTYFLTNISIVFQMKYTTPARDGTIGPRPIKASMLFEFDYRPKISSLLPHESHKEISAHLNIAWKSIGQDILQLYKGMDCNWTPVEDLFLIICTHYIW